MDALTTVQLRGRASWADCTPVAIPPVRLAQLETAWKRAEPWSIAQQFADPLHSDSGFLDHVEQHLLQEVTFQASKARRAILTNSGPIWTVRPMIVGQLSENVDVEVAADGASWRRGTPLPPQFQGCPLWLMCRLSGLSTPLLPEES